jgi:hypothetical protein
LVCKFTEDFESLRSPVAMLMTLGRGARYPDRPPLYDKCEFGETMGPRAFWNYLCLRR